MSSEATATNRSCCVPACRSLVKVPAVMCTGHWRRLSSLFADVREGTVDQDTFANQVKAAGKALRRQEISDSG